MLTRREFIKSGSTLAAGLSIVPRNVLGRGFVPPSDQLNIAIVGVGGKGEVHVEETVAGKERLAVFCDVDDDRAGAMYKKHPDVKRYKDYRVMLEKEKGLDGVIVCTPDHMHAVIAMAAMQMGKHVYVEKPLAHDVYEVRMMTEAARRYKVMTQMGNQGSSMDGVRNISEWIAAGLIGDVTRVHTWTNRPVWPQGVPTPTGKNKIPATLDWDLWLGTAKERDYNPAFLPFKWRGFWSYGTGALGDMACHIMDPVFRALKLMYPVSVEASTAQVWVGDFTEAYYPDSCPPASTIYYQFPARENMPPVELIWYDGGILPKRPAELLPNEMMGSWDGGCIFEGSKGKIMCGLFGLDAKLLPTNLMKDFVPPPQTLTRITDSHQVNWFKAIKTGEPASSNFDYSGPLSEAVLMGNLAIRSYDYRRLQAGKKEGDWAPYDYPGRNLTLIWDGPNMKITNFDEANSFVKREYRAGWSLGV